MKKIIIIDDNSKNQRKAYGAGFVDDEKYEHADKLFHIEKLNSESDMSFLDEAACIMMHDSLEDYIDGEFKSDSHKAKDKIDDFISHHNIPYVSFSDGHSIIADWREETPNVVYSIKKSEFYRHLDDFISNYAKDGSLDMKIIAYGKDFMKYLMGKWCLTIIGNLADKKDMDFVDTSYLDKKTLRLIIKNAQPKIDKTFDEIMCGIEDEEITVGQLRLNVNNIISSIKKYGTNISTWK